VADFPDTIEVGVMTSLPISGNTMTTFWPMPEALVGAVVSAVTAGVAAVLTGKTATVAPEGHDHTLWCRDQFW
jgi:hypothetical protein